MNGLAKMDEGGVIIRVANLAAQLFGCVKNAVAIDPVVPYPHVLIAGYADHSPSEDRIRVNVYSVTPLVGQ